MQEGVAETGRRWRRMTNEELISTGHGKLCVFCFGFYLLFYQANQYYCEGQVYVPTLDALLGRPVQWLVSANI